MKLEKDKQNFTQNKSLYKTVPAIVKDSIDLTFANDVSEPMANAKAGRSAVKIGRTTEKLGRKRAGIKIIQKTTLQTAKIPTQIAEV